MFEALQILSGNEMSKEKLKKYGYGALEFLSSVLLTSALYLSIEVILKPLPTHFFIYASLFAFFGLLLSMPYYKKVSLSNYFIDCLLHPLALCSTIVLVDLLFLGQFSFGVVGSAIVCVVIMIIYVLISNKNGL